MHLWVSLAVVTVSIYPLLAQQGTNLNFVNYGLPNATTSASCGSVTNGYSVDKQFNSQCFPRRVYCSAAGIPLNTTECENGYTYISDNDATCYDPATVYSSCGVTIMCGLEGITVYVNDASVFDQVDAPLQFGEQTSGNSQCQIQHNNGGYYTGTISFDDGASGPTLTGCGIGASVSLDDSMGDGYHIEYAFKLMRYVGRGSLVTNEANLRVEDQDSQSLAVITREKCFMVNAQCNYNPDGTVTAAYQPSTPNTLDEHDDNFLEFEMKPIDCSTGNEISPVTVFVDVDVCFVNKITTTWHPNIRISSTECWVTPSSDPNDAVYYRLSNFSTNHEATFGWICNGDGSAYKSSLYEEAFKFKSFRFQADTKINMQDESTYAQTMFVHCKVNACDDPNDVTSRDCVPHCGGRTNSRRARRATGGNPMLSTLTKTRTISKAIVMPKRIGRGAEFVETPVASYNLLSDTLSLGLFAVGCVFGVVALGLYVVTKRQNNAMKYRIMTNE